MWRVVSDAIKSDDATTRFLKILAGLTVTLVVILTVLAVAIWAISDPASTGGFVAALRVIIGLLKQRNPASSETVIDRVLELVTICSTASRRPAGPHAPPTRRARRCSRWRSRCGGT
jgi:hypothetical protein